MLFLVASILLCSSVVSAEEGSDAKSPPEIVIDAPPPTQSPVKQGEDTGVGKSDTITVYKSKVLPGFRPCTSEDFRNHDKPPIACEDEEAAREISTREQRQQPDDTIVDEDTVPQGNLFKLDFERFKRKK
jgi:hypothetical protein